MKFTCQSRVGCCVVFAILAVGCASSSPAPVFTACLNGSTAQCLCKDLSNGVQVCTGGVFSACECATAGDASADAGQSADATALDGSVAPDATKPADTAQGSTSDVAPTADAAAGTDSSAPGCDAGAQSGTGGACVLCPQTPAGGWGAGCTSKEDQTWFGTGDNGKTFPALIRKCTLGACAAKPDDAAIQKCIGDCIVKGSKLSQSCSNCYGTWAGWCGFKKCIGSCAIDDGTNKCDNCLSCHCTVNRDACVAGS